VEAAGLKTKFLQGQRVTDEATVKIVDDVLRARSTRTSSPPSRNSEAKRGDSPARKFSDAGKLSPNDEKGKPIDLGFVGEVYELNLEPLRECIRRSITPVISPTARGPRGQIYNCNADIAAAQTAMR